MKKARLSREDWTRAALTAMARGGPGAVAVDPLAKQLGATRGSFYWHFADREALLRAALELWEQEATADVIAALTAIPGPEERLRALFGIAFAEDPEEFAGLEPSIVAHAHDPVVEPVLRRVTEHRLAYLTSLYREMGAAEPARQGLVAYSAYLGWIELRKIGAVGPGAADLEYLMGRLLASEGAD
ncbi:TetR/AcrR family transcriptional regulator [Longispora albida]|uniref:TetR/AcrR family transcriptional regulator n=1 Tax=Longispora albida TaxID=203523 RepID=UPI00037A5AD6|nr:TetR/AcrR family transcriptional regulator [Longispora albida]